MRIQFKNKLAWVYFFIIVCLIFTVIPGWVPYVRKEWMLLVLGTLTTIILSANFLLSKSALCLYLYFIILYLNKMSGDVVYSSLPNIIFEVLQYLVPSAICLYMSNAPSFTSFTITEHHKLSGNAVKVFICFPGVRHSAI